MGSKTVKQSGDECHVYYTDRQDGKQFYKYYGTAGKPEINKKADQFRIDELNNVIASLTKRGTSC